MTHMLMSLAHGKVAVILEGGYNFQAISKSALAVTRTLMGEPPDRLNPTQATHHAVETVARVRLIQSEYWRCLNPKGSSSLLAGRPLHGLTPFRCCICPLLTMCADLLRQAQAKELYDRHKMTQLHIFRDNVSPSFSDQVLATYVIQNTALAFAYQL